METRQVKEIRHEGTHCVLLIQELSSGVIVLKIAGTDVGQFGSAPMQELNEILAAREPLELFPVELFIDARDVSGASLDVSSDWARWLSAHKSRLSRVHMATGSRFVQITAEFVRRFADLEQLMTVYTDAAQFDAALAQSLVRS
jgi:hypothetical protein